MKLNSSFKRILASVVAAACILAMTVTAFADDFTVVYPDAPMAVETKTGVRYLTTTAQRASSEIPLVLGLNVVGGNLFNGNLDMAGTSVNDNPDPYVWNYNYVQHNEGKTVASNECYEVVSGGISSQGMANGNGLYSSGGANQIMSTALAQYGGVSYGVYKMIDVWVGFNSDVLDQMYFVKNSMDKNSEYYQAGYATYDPMFTDVTTGTVTARAYAWVEMGNALSAYLAEKAGTGVDVRYGDPKALCYNIQEYSFGIPYYIDSLIEDGKIDKIKAAWINSTSDDGLTFTLADPATLGNVKSDAYAVGNIVDYIQGTYTMADLLQQNVGVIIIGSAGYGYTGGTIGQGQGPGQSNGASTLSRAYLEGLMQDAGATVENAPVIIDAANESVTPGTNGYNYAPTTPFFVPYIAAYMYLEQLAEVNPAINPSGLFTYMLDEFMHIKDDVAADMATYWIGKKWDATDSELDKVPVQPSSADFVYDKDAIEDAIKEGIEFALANTDNEAVYLNGAYREGETGYVLANAFKESGAASFADIIEEYSDMAGSVSFPDVADNAYYKDAVLYAANKGITKGYADGTFGPSRNCTRREILIFLWRLAGSPQPGRDAKDPSETFSDMGAWDSSTDTYKAVVWGISNGIVKGYDDGTFRPNDTIVRKDAMIMLYRTAVKPASSGSISYADILALGAKPGTDTYDSMLWAEKAGITHGYADGTFRPLEECQREHIVTFIYRYAQTMGDVAATRYKAADTDVTALVNYYGKAGLAALVEDYAAHMDKHPWQPDTTAEGTYGYGLEAKVPVEGSVTVIVDGQETVIDEAAIKAAASVVVTEDAPWHYNETSTAYGTFYSVKNILDSAGIDTSEAHGLKVVATDGFTSGNSQEELEKLYIFDQSEVIKNGQTAGAKGTFGLAIDGSAGNKWGSDVATLEVVDDHVWFFKGGQCRHWCSICGEAEPSIAITVNGEETSIYLCQMDAVAAEESTKSYSGKSGEKSITTVFYSVKELLANAGISLDGIKQIVFTADDGFTSTFEAEDLDDLFIYNMGKAVDQNGSAAGTDGAFGTAIDQGKGNQWAKGVVSAAIITE